MFITGTDNLPDVVNVYGYLSATHASLLPRALSLASMRQRSKERGRGRGQDRGSGRGERSEREPVR